MTTLYLDHVNRSLPSLREWLGGCWGLLLSHPSDFEERSLERDRWVEILRSNFREGSVRPIAYLRDGGEPQKGWITDVCETQQRVRLTRCEVIDMAARRLRDQLIELSASRFVAIVDPTLRSHAVLKYGCVACGAAISPFELLGLVEGVRRRSAAPANRPNHAGSDRARGERAEHHQIAVA